MKSGKKNSPENIFVLEESYTKNSLLSYIHRKRLEEIGIIFKKYVNDDIKTRADFGCSNGFLIEQILQNNDFKFNTIIGYDYEKNLLDLAKHKDIPNTVFEFLDLNRINKIPEILFDLVTCFETLEQVRDYSTLLINIYNFSQPGALIYYPFPMKLVSLDLQNFWAECLYARIHMIAFLK